MRAVWRLAALPPMVLLLGAGPVLVPEVSQDKVSIRGDFTGAQLLLFGAITYPRAESAREKADIVVVLKGPERSIVVREKQRIVGIWLNAASSEFRSAPSFYAVAASRPVEEIVDTRTADIYELGLDHLQLSPAGAIDSAEQRRFVSGLVDLTRRTQLYKTQPNSVEITDGVLYQARISLPARVAVGVYTAETFLVINKRVVAAETKEIRVEKTGFGRVVTRLARDYGFFYWLMAVALSVGLGWLGGWAFRKA